MGELEGKPLTWREDFLTAIAFFRLCVGRLADFEYFALTTQDILPSFALVERFAWDDAINF